MPRNAEPKRDQGIEGASGERKSRNVYRKKSARANPEQIHVEAQERRSSEDPWPASRGAGYPGLQQPEHD